MSIEAKAMNNKIEIFDSELIHENRKILDFIDYWRKALNIEIGWHYDLDFILLLNHLKRLNLPRGALIMDAGAGNGLMQFMLAALGYNIVSVDFAERDIPPAAKLIFDIRQGSVSAEIEPHRYRLFIQHKGRTRGIFRKIMRAFREPTLALGYIENRIRPYLAFPFWKEISRKKYSYGKIKYVYADFSHLPFLMDQTFDCIVSVSAIEHCDHEHIKKAIGKFQRLLKPNSCMLITTSVTKDKDWYFKACEGWCFSLESLKEIFGLEACEHNYNQYDFLFEKIKNNELIKRRISKVYFASGDNGLPWGIYEPKYQAAGIIKIK